MGTVITWINSTAAPSPIAVFTCLEIARKVHMPRKKLSGRFSRKIERIIMSR
jgi:hypothetical protein